MTSSSSGASSSRRKPRGVGAVVKDSQGAEDAPGLATDELQAIVLSPRSAKVIWITPHYADSEVRWGKTVRLEETPILQPGPVLVHSVLLSGLEPGATYFVQAVSRTAGEETVESDVIRFETIESEDYSVRKGHPRIIFNADDIPAIRKKLATTGAKDWADLKRVCESGLGKDAAEIAKSGSNSAYVRAFAFAGFFADDERFKKKAVDIALGCASLGVSGDKMDVRLRVIAVTSVYDWLYSYLSDGVRASLKDSMLEMYRLLDADSNDHEFLWGHSHGNHRPMLLVALALAGEDRTADENVTTLLKAYREGFFATWRSYGDDGGSLKGWWYTSWTLSMELDVLAAVRSSTHLDWYKTEGWYEKLVDWYIMGIRSDGSFSRSGDSRISDGFSHFEWIYALSVAHFYRSPRAKWLAGKIAETVDIWSLYNVYSILWDDADLAPEAPSGSLSRLHRTAGHVLLRDSWGADAVVAGFRSAQDYTLGHTHLDNNSFTIFYRGGLALDSGIYDDFSSSHHDNYYRRTVAHNSILVFDPDEKFTLFGETFVNDGGQNWRGKEDGVARSFPARVEEVLDPQNGFRAGGIIEYESTPDYTYALGDAAPSYSAKKLSVFDRHFLWLPGVAGRDKPVIVVFDEVVTTKPSFKKTYLLHTENRPDVRGNLVTAVNGGGVLFQRTLLPESPRVEVVGGPGKEFWVNGKNYAPQRDPMEKEEAGAWRVEISPPTANVEDQFLHVLYADDAGRGTPPACELIDASSMHGCVVDDWALLFGTSPAGVADVSYSVPKGASKHLLAGLVPNATYDVAVDGGAASRLTATAHGCLRFDSQGAVKVGVTRAPTTAAATSKSSDAQAPAVAEAVEARPHAAAAVQ